MLPEKIRERIYVVSGGTEALSAGRQDTVDTDELDEWIVREYSERPYPAVMIGSSNGAAVHLCTALGIPWLPQTMLIPVRRTGIHPDDMKADMEWGAEHARTLLEVNPDIQLYHMHDPNQDRLMIEFMT